VTDDRQTDHATEKCVAIGGLAYTTAILPNNNSRNNNLASIVSVCNKTSIQELLDSHIRVYYR